MDLTALRLKASGIALIAALIAGCGGLPAELANIPADAAGAVAGESVVPDELIIALTPGADQEALERLLSDQGATVRDRLVRLSAALLGVDPSHRDEVRDSLEASPLVESVLDNHIIGLEMAPDDPEYPRQWHLEAIEAPAAWAITTGSEEILVAVLDSGIDVDHADLASKLRSGGNTYDGTSGWDDVSGHGTAVAGVIGAASGNRAGIASVAPNCPIMPIRVTNSDSETTSWALAAGIALAVDEGAKVVNVSYSPSHHDDILLRQAELARSSGSLVVFSAGNSREQISGGGSDSALWVAAVTRDGSLAGFATYGDFVDLVAPGVAIYTTQLGNTYGTSTGASFATPVVSGVAALIWSVNPRLPTAAVQGILLSTATDLGPAGDDVRFGAGQVNARAAVKLAQVMVEQPDETPPAVSISQPVDGAAVSSVFIVTVEVIDDSDLADVMLSVDGAPLANDAVSPYAFVVDTAGYASGQHELSALATDIAGNASEHRTCVRFVDSKDTTPPVVRIVSPTGGSHLQGVVTILADASDNRLLARAEVLVDDRAVATIAIGRTEATIAYNWNASAPGVAPGPHTITVRVIDTSGNARAASVAVNTAGE